MRPSSKSSLQIAFGNPKWAAWSPCRWPISREPTLNANSPRLPGPATTPGQEVTSSVIRSLTRCFLIVPPRQTCDRSRSSPDDNDLRAAINPIYAVSSTRVTCASPSRAIYAPRFSGGSLDHGPCDCGRLAAGDEPPRQRSGQRDADDGEGEELVGHGAQVAEVV